MATSFLDGEKICEVSGTVSWSSVSQAPMVSQWGSLAVYKLSDSYYIHARTTAKKGKFLLKANKFQINSRDSRLTLSLSSDAKAVSIHLKEANPSQLNTFLDSLNCIGTSSCKGTLSSSSLRGMNIQDIENQPCNNMNSNTSAPRVSSVHSPQRSKLVSSSPLSPKKVTSKRPANYFAKQMNPPSSYKKTPLLDQTRARDNLSNTSSSSKSVSSFYGHNSGWSSSERKSTSTLGPGLMPPPRLSRQITFKFRDKELFEKEVTLTGFSNLGNTCYMNAILQSLLGVPPFVQDLSNKALLDRVHPHCLYKCLHSVMMCKRKCGHPEVLKGSLRKLKRTISEAATRFSGYHQHDAHEFLCQVFDQLRDDVNTGTSPSSKSTAKEGNDMVADTECPVSKSFESAVLHTVSCKQCGELALKEEIYHAFSLDIPALLPASSSLSAINMQMLIEKHFKDEELEYKCGKCEAKEAVISHSFNRLPRVLVLHLKRYEYDNLTEEQAKKQDKVNIERFIDLSMLCSSKTKPPLAFHPKSTIRMSSPKSKQKPQKRHLIREDDDDDSGDFKPSPSVRRKLGHSFQNTSSTSPFKASSGAETVGPKSGEDTMGLCELNIMDDFVSDNKENNSNDHLLASKNPLWKRTEDEQLAWALKESAKSAKKAGGSRTQQGDDSEAQHTGNLAWVSSLSANKPLSKNKVSACLPEDPVWASSGQEQIYWALAESGKSVGNNSSKAELKTQQVDDSEVQYTGKRTTKAVTPSKNHFLTKMKMDCNDSDAVTSTTNDGLAETKASVHLPEYMVWESLEEEQVMWALKESTKSAEKASRAKPRKHRGSGSEQRGKFGSAASLSVNESMEKNNDNDWISGNWTSVEDVEETMSSVNLPEELVWTRSEDEQIKWALAESAKSAEKELRTRPSNSDIKIKVKCKFPKTLGDDYFAFISDVSDEDLVNAAQERTAGEPVGLKGGGPITTQTCLDEPVVGDVNGSGMARDEVRSYENGSDNAGVQLSAKKPVILKNTPIKNFNKYRRKTVYHKQKAHTETAVLNTTPTLGRFDGNLFDDVPKSPKCTSNNLSPCGTTKSSGYHNSAAKFRDGDMEKAINRSLQDQQKRMSEEDEELKRALQLSLQEYEDRPVSPEKTNDADTENLSYSTIQDEESDLSTHSYRLISIVSHLGTRSTSGHYISDVYDCKAKQWTSYDDSTATKVQEHGVRYKRQQSGYIFFYLYKQCVDAIENSASVKETK